METPKLKLRVLDLDHNEVRALFHAIYPNFPPGQLTELGQLPELHITNHQGERLATLRVIGWEADGIRPQIEVEGGNFTVESGP